jgi:hypothetical protein
MTLVTAFFFGAVMAGLFGLLAFVQTRKRPTQV